MPLPDPVIHATYAVAATNRSLSKLPESVFELPGLSSDGIRRLLNNLCNFDGCRFLEVGAFYGATAVAASYSNHGRFVTIDNFCQFGGREQCQETLTKYSGVAPVELIDQDAWSVPHDSLAPIDVFFYDGMHDTASTQRAIEYFAPAMAEMCIVVVDDWNWPEVRAGLRAARPERPWHPLAQWELFTADIPTRKDDSEHYKHPVWWNGLFIGVYSANPCGLVPRWP